MNKKIVAEYVEHEDLFEPLRECGVDYLQGYAIDKPTPLDELLTIEFSNVLAS